MLKIYLNNIFFIITVLCSSCVYSQLDPKIIISFEDTLIGKTKNVLIDISNTDTLDYWYHIQVSRKQNEKWVPIVDRHKDFFKIGYVESHSTKKEKLNIKDILAKLDGLEMTECLKVDFIFTKKGVHPIENHIELFTQIIRLAS